MDVSNIVKKQYSQFSTWVDLVSVHAMVNNDVISGLSGAMIIANMSKQNYGYYEKAAELTRNNKNNVIGYISYNFIEADGLICMMEMSDSNQSNGGAINMNVNNRTNENIRIDNVDQSKYIIVGKEIFDSDNIVAAIQKYSKYSI